jgi:hypothetical protein
MACNAQEPAIAAQETDASATSGNLTRGGLQGMVASAEHVERGSVTNADFGVAAGTYTAPEP